MVAPSTVRGSATTPAEGGWVADAPMRRYKAGRRAVCCGRWAGAQPLLRPRPRPFARAQAQRLARRQEQGPGRTRAAEEADKGPRGRGPGRHGGPGQGGGCQSALQHPHKGRRAGAQDEGARGAGRAPGSAGGGLEGEEGRMRKNGLRRHYDRLTPEERFRLDVSAMARWDATARMPRPPAWSDPDAEEPEGADEDALIGRDMEDLDWKLNKYGELLPEIMDRMERELAGDALSLWTGFETFCAEGMGVGAEKILAATLQEGPGEEAVGRVEELKTLAGRLGLEPNAQSVEEIGEGLLEAWRVIEEKGI